MLASVPTMTAGTSLAATEITVMFVSKLTGALPPAMSGPISGPEGISLFVTFKPWSAMKPFLLAMICYDEICASLTPKIIASKKGFFADQRRCGEQGRAAGEGGAHE